MPKPNIVLKNPQDKHFKSEMVAYVEINLCRIKIVTINYFSGTNSSHIARS